YYPFTTLFGYKSPTDLLFHCCWFLFTFKSNTNIHYRSRLFIQRAYITTKLAFLFSRPIFITQFTEEFLTTVPMELSCKIHTKTISTPMHFTHHISLAYFNLIYTISTQCRTLQYTVIMTSPVTPVY